MKIFFLLLLFSVSILAQGDNLHSPANIKKFAEYLFCQKDYLRSVFEFENYLNKQQDDLVKFKLGLAFQKLDEYDSAAAVFQSLFKSASLGNPSKIEYYNSFFHKEDYSAFRELYLTSDETVRDTDELRKLYYFSFLLDKETLPDKNEFVNAFNPEEGPLIDFYERKANPPYKNELTAAILSALIPGAGKIYTEQYGDGITAFIVTGLLGYLSYSNFHANHDFRGWLFGGLAAVFYAGNIYGSAASANIYNAGVQFNFDNDLKFFLNGHNYFMPEYNFCK